MKSLSMRLPMMTVHQQNVFFSTKSSEIYQQGFLPLCPWRDLAPILPYRVRTPADLPIFRYLQLTLLTVGHRLVVSVQNTFKV